MLGSLAIYVLPEGQTFVKFTTGSTTAGADGNVSYLTIPGGLNSLFTGIGVYYPNGEETQRVGIQPDIIVTPTVKGIREAGMRYWKRHCPLSGNKLTGQCFR
ncbi:S41 family peptidase [Chitinophaga polysaccharea]|uniref:hypothetical protein n=1 Tax=Chitinophaga polysaccharea TaxID=1293035 RepID=UPI00119FD74A|nr:hypothetical protein [Chitinophaga polysaccharea]